MRSIYFLKSLEKKPFFLGGSFSSLLVTLALSGLVALSSDLFAGASTIFILKQS